MIAPRMHHNELYGAHRLASCHVLMFATPTLKLAMKEAGSAIMHQNCFSWCAAAIGVPQF
jgi:hypothetical protein